MTSSPPAAPGEPEVALVPARPVEDEGRLVMAWRNDPDTLAASFRGQPRTWPAFLDEYRGYFAGPPPGPCFGVAGGERVAFLRFRPCADPEGRGRSTCDISINVAPVARGRGLGRALIAAATAEALRHFQVVLAEIKPGNAASRRAFLAAGYRAIAAGTHDVAGEAVPVERYLAP